MSTQEITKIAKLRMEHKLSRILEDLERVTEELQEARAKGDLSENTEYDLALAEFTKLTSERTNLEYILETAKVRQTYPTNIVPGCLISVKFELPNGEWKDLGLKFFDSHGGILFEGVITANSNLGKAINGGTSGTYIVKALNGTDVKYQVNIEPESRSEEYLRMFPPNRSEILDEIFDLGGSK